MVHSVMVNRGGGGYTQRAFSVAAWFTMSTGKKVDHREECYWTHAYFKPAGMGTNGIKRLFTTGTVSGPTFDQVGC